MSEHEQPPIIMVSHERKTYPQHEILLSELPQNLSHVSMIACEGETRSCPRRGRIRCRRRLGLGRILLPMLLLPTAASIFCEQLYADTWDALIETIEAQYGVPICPFAIEGSGCDSTRNGYDVRLPDLSLMCDNVSSNNGIGECRINCPGRHFTVHPGAKLTLQDMTLRGATEASVMVLNGGKFNSFNSYFERNRYNSGNGGAIHGARGSQIEAVNTGFHFNTALNGGAIYNLGEVVLSNSLFYYNDAENGSGGAIFSGASSRSKFFDNTIRRNTASFYGPAVFDGSSSRYVSNGNIGCENENSINFYCDGIFGFVGAVCSEFTTECEARSSLPPRVQGLLDEPPPVFQFPTQSPSAFPSLEPSYLPSTAPSVQPSSTPSAAPSQRPSLRPTDRPSTVPSITSFPSSSPSSSPSWLPSSSPSDKPSVQPSFSPLPSSAPSREPTSHPNAAPSATPTMSPTTKSPSRQPTSSPVSSPSSAPSWSPTFNPTATPSVTPTMSPTTSRKPTSSPISSPSSAPSRSPAFNPTAAPSATPTMSPTTSRKPTSSPTSSPSSAPSRSPTFNPTTTPSATPTMSPTNSPSWQPTSSPTSSPSSAPSRSPTFKPTTTPSATPTMSPTKSPSRQPTSSPVSSPSSAPSRSPTFNPAAAPSAVPSMSPTKRNPSGLPPVSSPTWLIEPKSAASAASP